VISHGVNGAVTGSALGMSVNDFNESKDLEVMTFRRNAMTCCKRFIDERESSGPAGLAMSIYPPDVHSSAQLPPHIMRKIQKGNRVVFVDISVVISHNVASVSLLFRVRVKGGIGVMVRLGLGFRRLLCDVGLQSTRHQVI